MLINSLIHFKLLFFELIILVSVFLHLILFLHLCGYCSVGTNVFIVKSYPSPYLSLSLFSNMKWLIKYFHALHEDYESPLFASKMNPTQPLHLFSLLSFIHSVCGPYICYISFLCYSSISKSMIHFYSEIFYFLTQER